ncbi:hypothetical protein QUF72_22970, partial [Desulfobacterales bacterium HSG2]|nr:hypothetical protein [Desulfobacterales bacterium HSG2]
MARWGLPNPRLSGLGFTNPKRAKGNPKRADQNWLAGDCQITRLSGLGFTNPKRADQKWLAGIAGFQVRIYQSEPSGRKSEPSGNPNRAGETELAYPKRATKTGSRGIAKSPGFQVSVLPIRNGQSKNGSRGIAGFQGSDLPIRTERERPNWRIRNGRTKNGSRGIAKSPGFQGSDLPIRTEREGIQTERERPNWRIRNGRPKLARQILRLSRLGFTNPKRAEQKWLAGDCQIPRLSGFGFTNPKRAKGNPKRAEQNWLAGIAGFQGSDLPIRNGRNKTDSRGLPAFRVRIYQSEPSGNPNRAGRNRAGETELAYPKRTAQTGSPNPPAFKARIYKSETGGTKLARGGLPNPPAFRTRFYQSERKGVRNGRNKNGSRGIAKSTGFQDSVLPIRAKGSPKRAEQKWLAGDCRLSGFGFTNPKRAGGNPKRANPKRADQNWLAGIAGFQGSDLPIRNEREGIRTKRTKNGSRGLPNPTLSGFGFTNPNRAGIRTEREGTERERPNWRIRNGRPKLARQIL